MTQSEGGVFIIADFPSINQIEFGVDCIAYETGKNFIGMGLIPAGLHFVYYSTGMGPRQGFFIDINNDVHVRPWDSVAEEIAVHSQLSEESMKTLQESLKRGDLNGNIGPYPYSQHQIWKNLTCFINKQVLARSDAQLYTQLYPGDSDDLTTIEAQKLVSDKKQNRFTNKKSEVKQYFPGSARIARFCDLKAFEINMRERIIADTSLESRAGTLTSLHMDKSDIISNLISIYFNDSSNDFLGEIQLSFVLFMALFSYPALESWKNSIALVCSSEKYLKENHLFTIGFIRLMYEQINFAPSDFFEDELSKDNFLGPSLSSLFCALSDISQNSPIYEHKKRLLTFASKKFNIHENTFEQPFLRPLDDYLSKALLNRGAKDTLNLEVIGEDLPVVVLVDDEIKADESLEANSEYMEVESMIVGNFEDLVFSWRYPLLSDSIKGKDANEDFYMAAARVIDEFGDLLNDIPSISFPNMNPKEKNSLYSLVLEAKMFLEMEVRSN